MFVHTSVFGVSLVNVLFFILFTDEQIGIAFYCVMDIDSSSLGPNYVIYNMLNGLRDWDYPGRLEYSY